MEHDLTKGPVCKTLIAFVLPFFGAMILQFLYSVVDMIIVGRFSDPAAITAVNTSSQIMTIITAIVQGIATGGTVVIGQYIGQKRLANVKSTIRTMCRISIIIGIALTIILLFGNYLLISITQVPMEAVVPAQTYLYICSLGIIFIAGYNGIAGILRGIGDAKTPMYFIACSCLLNILGDYILVGVLGKGAPGAAIATVIAQIIACILSIIALQRSSHRIAIQDFLCKDHECTQILKIGIPIAAQDFLTNISFLLITVFVNEMDMVNKSAGVGVVERLLGFCMLVPFAYLSALSAFTAQNVGAGLIERTRQGLRASLLTCGVISLFIFIAIELWPTFFVGLFSSNTDVISYGVDYCRTYSIDILLVVYVFCFNGFFSGYGKTMFTMVNNLVSTFLVRVPLVFFISRNPQVSLLLIGFAAPCASTVQIVIQSIYFFVVRDWHPNHQ